MHKGAYATHHIASSSFRYVGMKCGETYTPEYTYVNNAYLVEEHYGRHLRLLDILLEREVCQELCDMWLLQQSELFVNGWGRTRGVVRKR